MVFHIIHDMQQKITYRTLFIDNVNIDCVDEFNFLGFIIHKHLTWNSHTNIIASKISSTIGILNRLKHHFPPNILEIIYNSLILSHLHYGILLWGYNHKRIGILQKTPLE